MTQPIYDRVIGRPSCKSVNSTPWSSGFITTLLTRGVGLPVMAGCLLLAVLAVALAQLAWSAGLRRYTSATSEPERGPLRADILARSANGLVAFRPWDRYQ